MPFSFCSKPRSALPCPVSKPRPCLRFYFPAPNAFSPILFSHIPCNKRPPPPFLSAFLFNARALALSIYPSKAFLIQPNSFAALAVPCSFSCMPAPLVQTGGFHFLSFAHRLPHSLCFSVSLCFVFTRLNSHIQYFIHPFIPSIHIIFLFRFISPHSPRLLNPIRRPVRCVLSAIGKAAVFLFFRPINAKLCPFLLSLPLLSPPALFSLSYSVNHTAFQPSAFSLL